MYRRNALLSKLRSFIKIATPSFMMPAIVSIVSVAKQQWSRRRIKRLLKSNREIYVELGSGSKKGEGKWVTIDHVDGCDIFWDLRNGLPFPDESITKLYSSHFFEHLTFIEGQQFLDECLRVMIPGGIFSICVPNARLYIEAYLRSDTLDSSQFYKPAYNNTTKIDYLNYQAYMDGHHKYMFDEENLIYILESKGFKNPHIRQFDPSLDLEARDFESIYAEAEKQGSSSP
jgi:predicted SAM-dependent methyltransferase